MVSLAYDTNTGKLCGELAIDIVQRIKPHSAEASQPSSFRFHMAASLGGAILILATLLSRSLASIGLEENIQAYAENFRLGVTILHDLAIYLQAARRMADDLKNIIQVVMTILDQSHLTPLTESSHLLPSNIDTLFPYGAVDFAQQANMDFSQANHAWTGADGNEVFSHEAFTSLDSWENELQPMINGYGVPWI